MEIETGHLNEQLGESSQRLSRLEKQESPSSEDIHKSPAESSFKASENQEVGVKSGLPKHKLSKKIQKLKSKPRTKSNTKKVPLDDSQMTTPPEQTCNETALNSRNLLAPNTNRSQPVSSYTFFAEQIQQYYLSKPDNTHFQTVENLITVGELQPKCILNQVPPHAHRKWKSLQGYMDLIQNTRRKQQEIVAVSREQEETAMGFCAMEHHEGNGEGKIDLRGEDWVAVPDEDVKLLGSRQKFMSELTRRQQNYNECNQGQEKHLSEISMELLFLNQYLKKKHQQNKNLLQRLKQGLSDEITLAPPPSVEVIEDQMAKLMLEKNLALALAFVQIDVMNYFKIKACEQEKRDFIPIQSQKKMVEYIKKKRPTKTKKPKNPLYTSCTACLSGYSQQNNPLTYCHDCFCRIHRNCRIFLNNDECCRLCAAKRMRVKKRDFVECVLCPVEGLTYMKLGNVNIHAFCIIASNKYSIHDQVVEILPSLIDGQETASPCYVCQKISNKLYNFADADASVHPTCAFLAGYHMTFVDRQLSISCNTLSPEDRVKNQFFRKYKLNYGGIAFRCYVFEDYMKQLYGPNPSSKDNHSSSLKEEKQEWESEEVVMYVDEELFEDNK